MSEKDIVYVKCILTGAPARIIKELKRSGAANSVREVLVQGLFALEEKALEREIRLERRDALRREQLESHRDQGFDE